MILISIEKRIVLGMGINIKPAGFSDYIIRKEIIKVKDTTDVVLNVKVSRHGPVMNGLITV
jgi:hypothetical protein